ncbi:MAG: 5-formyltetrahydrofolate cyclo-ligase [Acutalibacteraceae bacterium]
MGYGKGYYDRFLSEFKGVTVGICYTSCVQYGLPHGYFDRPVDILVTENYIRRTEKKQ